MKYYIITRKPGIKLTNDYAIMALAVKRYNKLIVMRNVFEHPHMTGTYGKNLGHEEAIVTKKILKDWKQYYIWKEIPKKKYNEERFLIDI